MSDAQEDAADRHDAVAFLFETAVQPTLLATASGGVLDGNERALETLDCGQSSLASMHVEDLVGAETASALRDRVAALEAGEAVTEEVDLRRPDGTTFPAAVTVRETALAGRELLVLSWRDVTDRRERRRALERFETIVATVEDGVYVLDSDLRFVFVNDALCEMVEVPREEMMGSPAMEYFEYEDEVAVARQTRRRVVDGDTSTGTFTATYETSDGPRRIETRYRLHPGPEGAFRGSVGVIRDVTEREARERTLRRQRDELVTLDRLNELLLETVRAVIQTSSRDAVERVVCERLAEAPFYDLAWIGEREFTGDRIPPRVVAGERAEYLDEVTFKADDGSPAGRALATESVEVTHVDDPSFEPWREPARERGLEMVAAVPVRYGDQVYGVLEVASPQSGRFTERERAGFDALGRTMGFVVYASRSRDLLFADSVVELEFDLTDADVPLVDREALPDCVLRLDGYVPVGEEWLCYLTIDGASSDAVLDACLAGRTIGQGRVITDGDGGGTIELTVAESPLLETVTGVGASVGDVTAGSDGVRVAVDAPADLDAREVVKRVREAVPGAEFVSHRERNREITIVGRPDGVLGDLTDRQREVLRAAYRAGYFEWPRESEAASVAEALDIDRSTMHAHLRKAQARLLSALLDEE